MFDLLNIGLYHGWLLDPLDTDAVNVVGRKTYNQLVEQIICDKHAPADDDMAMARGAFPFLNCFLEKQIISMYNPFVTKIELLLELYATNYGAI